MSEFDARLLMNHAIQGVNAGYITRHKLLDTHLRKQQNAISDLMMAEARAAAKSDERIAKWLSRRDVEPW